VVSPGCWLLVISDKMNKGDGEGGLKTIFNDE
jgi:hypothetical protein